MKSRNIEVKWIEVSKKNTKRRMIMISQGNRNREYVEVDNENKAEKIAYDYCRKNDLDYEVLQGLTYKIEQVMNDNCNDYSAVDKTQFTGMTSTESPSNIKPSNVTIISGHNNLQSYSCEMLQGSKLNYGERLYHKCLKIQLRTNDKLSLLKKELNNKQSTTFKPKTNSITYSALSKRIYHKRQYNDEDTILGYKQHKEQLIDELREKYKEKPFSFSPKLNKQSLKIAKSISLKNIKRYDLLYNHHKFKQSYINKLEEKIYDRSLFFKPKTNHYDCTYTSMSFNDRQEYFLSKSVKKLRQTQQLLEHSCDTTTNQPLFHPIINIDTKKLKPIRLNTFEHLYLDSAKNKTKKNKVNATVAKYFQTSQNTRHITEASSDIYEELKCKAFHKIFAILDKDQDQMITYRNMNVKALPKNIDRILKPILDDLKEEEDGITARTFMTACFYMFDKLTYMNKRELIQFTHVKHNKTKLKKPKKSIRNINSYSTQSLGIFYNES